MFTKEELQEKSCDGGRSDVIEEAETILRRLKILKSRISELRRQCEELRTVHIDNKKNPVLCSECGKAVEPGQEIIYKEPQGTDKKCYHKDCFKQLWI